MLKTQLLQKSWGSVYHAFDNQKCAVSVLYTNTGAYCSRHIHTERVNRFMVVSGCIDVVRYTPDGENEMGRVRLRAGDIEDVEALVVHSFEVVEGGIVTEVYYPAYEGAKVRLDDIKRLRLGAAKC